MITDPSKISVIVPVYNAEIYLEKCIRSILCQTYTNFECILINDGSTDLSRDICNRLALSDERIIVHHQDNAGVAVARNKGLDVANGDWVMFIDADDWIEPDTLAKSISVAREHQADIVGFNLVVDIPSKVIPAPPIKPNIIIKEREDLKFLIIDTMLPCYDLIKNNVSISISNIRSSCCKLYSKNTYDKLRFIPGVAIGEDMLFCISAYNIVTKVVFINEYLYHYTSNTSSAMYKFRPDIGITNTTISQFAKKINFDRFSEQEITIYNLGLIYECLYNELNFFILHKENNNKISEKIEYLDTLLKNDIYNNIHEHYRTEYLKIFPIHQRLFLLLCKKKKVGMILLLMKLTSLIKRYMNK